MKAANIADIKQELNNLPTVQLLELCLRLAKYKKDNKELLNFILFESHDEQAYLANIKAEMDMAFDQINKSNVYFAKKSLRKILRDLGKQVRYIASKPAEVELLLHFCTTLKNSSIPVKKNAVLNNLYLFQLKKIEKIIATLHEDLQYDYLRQLRKLET